MKFSNGWTERIETLEREKAELLESCRELAVQMRNNYNVIHMIGPEYGIWHRAVSRIYKAEGGNE